MRGLAQATPGYEKAQERMTRFLSSAGTLLLASHSDELLRRFCRRGLVFDSGRLVYSGPLDDALEYYHPQPWFLSCEVGVMTQICSRPAGISRASVRSTVKDAWRMRRAWWFTASSRTRARFARTFFGSFWLGLSNLLSITALALVYGTVFKVQDFSTYVVYLGIGLVVWNGIGAAIGSAPNLFEHNQTHVPNTNLNRSFMFLRNGHSRYRLFCNLSHWFCSH